MDVSRDRTSIRVRATRALGCLGAALVLGAGLVLCGPLGQAAVRFATWANVGTWEEDVNRTPNWLDESLDALLRGPHDATEREIVARYAPLLLFDREEPFLPVAAGYTIFRRSGPSPSFPRQIGMALPDGGTANIVIEYAIWWDWDIGHLYELEHAWVYVDDEGSVARAEASWHGDLHDMAVDGRLRLEGDRVVLYSQPGKHAFAPDPAWFDEFRGRRRSSTYERAGSGGVLVKDMFAGQIDASPVADTLARTYLSDHAFHPAWEFDRRYTLPADALVPWEDLKTWIPERVNRWIGWLGEVIAPAQYRFLRVGHRGASGHATDNTLTALRTAVELGADAAEIDVQRTRDGHVVVVHDAYLHAPDGRLLPIGSSTLADLQAVVLPGDEHVPTLEEVLDLAREIRLGLYIEIKDGGSVRPLVAALRERGLLDHVMVGSFRPDWVAEAHGLAPELRTSILFSSRHIDPVALAQGVGASYVHPCWGADPARPEESLTPEWVARMRAAGLGIIIWHEEHPDVIAHLRTLGIDGVCSDLPERLV